MVHLQCGGRQKFGASAEIARQCIPSYIDRYQFVRYLILLTSRPTNVKMGEGNRRSAHKEP